MTVTNVNYPTAARQQAKIESRHGSMLLTALAAAVRTSESTLFARFRQVTGISPVQYLRRLRLGDARRRMIVLGDDAAQAAVAVGYRSASHFSRDYRALHGRPPAADAGRARVMLARGEVAIA